MGPGRLTAARRAVDALAERDGAADLRLVSDTFVELDPELPRNMFTDTEVAGRLGIGRHHVGIGLRRGGVYQMRGNSARPNLAMGRSSRQIQFRRSFYPE